MADDILPEPDPPAGLKEAALRGIVVPFVGAGASMIAGCPDWRSFANGALNSLIEQGKFKHSQFDQIRDLHPRVKLTLAKSLETEHSVEIDYRKVLYPSGPAMNEKGQRLYGALSRLAKMFVTTNYDIWLDTEIAPPAQSTSTDTPESTPSVPLRRRSVHRVSEFTPDCLVPGVVVHLHGSIEDSRNMVLSTQDYVQHYRSDRGMPENLVLTFLDMLFSKYTVLFVGYGLEELDILEHVIGKARQQSQAEEKKQVRHYLLQGFYSHEFELMKSLKRYYQECGIELIPFLRDNKNWDQLIDALAKFARAMPAADPMRADKLLLMEDLLNG